MRLLLCSCLCLVMVWPAWAQEPGEGMTPVEGRPPAPDFALTDIDGETHRLSDYLGRVVVVNFWATWCPPCRAEMPSMERVWTQIEPEGMQMLGVNVGEDEDVIFQFTANYPVSFPLPMDLDSAVVTAWPVRGLPTTYVVDTQGRLAYQAVGGREWDDPKILEQLRALQAETLAAE